MIKKLFYWIQNNKFLFFSFVASFVLIIYGFGAIFLELGQSDLIVLKYVYPKGIIWVDNFKNLFLFFLTSLAILIINFLLAKRFGERDRFLGLFIAFLNFFVCILIFIYFMSIIFIN